MIAPVQEVVELFFERPDAPDEGPRRTVSLRMEAERLAWVDALAQNADVSRNVMLGQLVRVGISEVLARLPDEVREDVEHSVIRKLEDE